MIMKWLLDCKLRIVMNDCKDTTSDYLENILLVKITLAPEIEYSVS